MLKKLSLIFLLASLFVGCADQGAASKSFGKGQGSQQSPGDNPSDDNGDDSDNGNSDTDLVEVDPNIDFSAGFDVGFFKIFGFNNRINLLNYNIVEREIVIMLPFPAAKVLNVSGSLPNYPSIKYATDRRLNTLNISIPLKIYSNLVKNPSNLPSGRPLPGQAGGEPPTLGFSLPGNLKVHGYLGADYVSFFMESDFKLPFLTEFELDATSNQNGRVVGSFAWLRQIGQHKGGPYLSISFPRDLAVLIANQQ